MWLYHLSVVLLLSKCKTSEKSGKKSERSETEDNTFLSGKIPL